MYYRLNAQFGLLKTLWKNISCEVFDAVQCVNRMNSVTSQFVDDCHSCDICSVSRFTSPSSQHLAGNRTVHDGQVPSLEVDSVVLATCCHSLKTEFPTRCLSLSARATQWLMTWTQNDNSIMMARSVSAEWLLMSPLRCLVLPIRCSYWHHLTSRFLHQAINMIYDWYQRFKQELSARAYLRQGESGLDPASVSVSGHQMPITSTI